MLSALIDSPDTADMGAVDANDRLYGMSGLAQTLSYVVTAVLFVLWLLRACSNAEAMLPVPHRRHAAWAVFGWVVPIVHLWYPKQIVDDVWTTSRLGAAGFRGPGHATLHTARRAGLVRAW
ncbi:hypothetical protein PS9374_02855 [Planomonospora sphaerica]|uniref:DUF4328 domain-containing protein n=1 Tax=Planomonospora sphaerica TaxID=161355 RepID=A0A171CTQ1_9ACTN|nr:DUF4328 domain-containing protein [Planomonospora sphaerica]GAT67202.1 hypothetical protein PS9374_02855 [Planomonospora sphaerica]